MNGEPCQVASETKLETPEGPLTVATIARTPVSVLTRDDGGRVRFAMTKGHVQLGERRPVVRLTLANGHSFRVGEGQVLFRTGGEEVRAADIRAGDDLESVFAFPAGYVYRTDAGEEMSSTGGVRVTGVEPAGDAEVYSLRVHVTGRFALSNGVLAKAAGN